VRAHTTGIADLNYRVNNQHYDAKRSNYPAYLEGSDRYVGAYDIAERLETRSNNSDYDYNSDLTYDWLPCCSIDWGDISDYGNGQGSNPQEFFDYT
jgi:hypothetical protein